MYVSHYAAKFVCLWCRKEFSLLAAPARARAPTPEAHCLGIGVAFIRVQACSDEGFVTHKSFHVLCKFEVNDHVKAKSLVNHT